jgi:hypothetical protein
VRDGAGHFHQVVQDVQLQSQQTQLKWGPMWFQDSFGERICPHKICFPRRGQMGRQWPPQNYKLSDGTRASTWRLYCYYLLFYYMFLGMYAFWLASESHDCWFSLGLVQPRYPLIRPGFKICR